MVFCRACGKEIHESAVSCPFCGAIQKVDSVAKKILPAFLLCLFLGLFGAHRFYAGKIGSGVAMLLITVFLGWLGIGLIITGIWALVDLIIILVGNFTDKDGNKITQWT